MQDALLELLKRWPNLPEGIALDAYVRRSVVNASLRVIARRVPSAQLDELDHLPSRRTDPAEAIANADQVWRLYSSLSPIKSAAGGTSLQLVTSTPVPGFDAPGPGSCDDGVMAGVADPVLVWISQWEYECSGTPFTSASATRST